MIFTVYNICQSHENLNFKDVLQNLIHVLIRSTHYTVLLFEHPSSSAICHIVGFFLNKGGCQRNTSVLYESPLNTTTTSTSSESNAAIIMGMYYIMRPNKNHIR